MQWLPAVVRRKSHERKIDAELSSGAAAGRRAPRKKHHAAWKGATMA